MRQLILILAAIQLFSQSAFAEIELIQLSGMTMGTSYSIRCYQHPGQVDTDALQHEIEQRLEHINDLMSTWREDSEIFRFNRSDSLEWFPVAPETAHVVMAARQISETTQGAFDITVAPLVSLWQFGAEPSRQPPTQEALETARANVGWDTVSVRLDPPAIRKVRGDVTIDLSGIAKGFGVDELARLLEGHGLDRYLVEIGGEVRLGRPKPDGSSWQVGIEQPTAKMRRLQRILHVHSAALATSGDYRNVRHLNGREISHMIDPRSGQPVDHEMASVTVIAKTCLEADALATALMVLGPQPAYDWAVQHDLAALFIMRQPDGWIERTTASFDEYTSGPATKAKDHAPMMSTYVLAMLVFVVAVAAMAVGVMVGRSRLRGTCGGLANLRDKNGSVLCDACHDPAPDCEGVSDGKRRDRSSDR